MVIETVLEIKMKRLMAIGVMIVLMVLPSILLAQEYIGGVIAPNGMPCEVYYVGAGQYAMVFPFTEESFEVLVTLHGPRVIMLFLGKDVFSSDPPYDTWTMHGDTEDVVLDNDTFGHILCSIIAEHFLKPEQVV